MQISLAPAFLVATLLSLTPGCHKDETLGLADSYLVYEPVMDAAGAPRKSASGLPFMKPVPLDDTRVGALHASLGLGFAGEVLRTDYLAKQFIREARVGGKGYASGAVAEAREPTVFVLGGSRADAAAPPFGVGFATEGWFGRFTEHRSVVWVEAGTSPGDDNALAQTLSGKLGRLLAERVANVDGLGAKAPAPAALVDGLGQALEVIAREWRAGEGPQGALAPDAGTASQRARFADIRENRCVYVGAGVEGGDAHTAERNLNLRGPEELVADPCVAATVLYRIIQAKLVGRKVAPADFYAAFAKDRVPPGVSPAAVFGPVRNALVKCLGAWGAAVLGGRAPTNLAELVAAYGAAIPSEKNEAYRLLVVTTYGGTVQAGGIPGGARDEKAAAALAALAAEAAAGRRPLLVSSPDR